MTSVIELIKTLRATREYSQQAVSEEDMRAILDAGRRAQSSKNSQPWTFVVVRERETLARLKDGGNFAAHVPHAAFAVAIVTENALPSDAGQAIAYMQLAAWELGIGSCITWMHHTEKAKEILGIPADLQFQLLLPFGYPAQKENPQPPRKGGRKPLDEVVRWERW